MGRNPCSRLWRNRIGPGPVLQNDAGGVFLNNKRMDQKELEKMGTYAVNRLYSIRYGSTKKKNPDPEYVSMVAVTY